MKEVLPLYLLQHGHDKVINAVLEDGNEKIINEELMTNKYELIKGYRAHGSPNVIKLPFNISCDLSYLTGVLLGDGTVHSPIVRIKGGYYWKITFTCQGEYMNIISRLIEDIFNYKPIKTKDKRKSNCWYVTIHSRVIHSFFNNVIGIPFGSKKGKTYWPNNFCISNNYISIVQKDREFLNNLKKSSNELLKISFNGPNVNRKIENKIVGWCIYLGKSKKKDFLNKVPLRYKGP
jgi:hypothetical protein